MVLSMGVSMTIPWDLRGNPHGASNETSSASMESSVTGVPMEISRKFHGGVDMTSMGFLRTQFSMGDSMRLPWERSGNTCFSGNHVGIPWNMLLPWGIPLAFRRDTMRSWELP